MTNSAALSGDYVDLRFIKSRKVCQVIIEIPNPATGVPVAIARLQEGVERKTEKPKRSWSELSKAEQAGIACEDGRFGIWLARDDEKQLSVQGCVEYVHRYCGVKSRSELNRNPIAAMKWDELYSDFQRWQRGAAA